MKFEDFRYDVKVALRFTPEEARVMGELARGHYDDTCRLAGCAIGQDGARENGYIAQLELFFADEPVTWTTRQIDLALKCLEPYALSRSSPVQMLLSKGLSEAFHKAQERWKELDKETT
jgi:hypothetical protein